MKYIKSIRENWEYDYDPPEPRIVSPERELPAAQRLFIFKVNTNWLALFESKETKELWIVDMDGVESYDEWFDDYHEYSVQVGAFDDDMQREELEIPGLETLATDLFNGRVPKGVDPKKAIWSGDTAEGLSDVWELGEHLMFRISTPEVADEVISRIMDITGRGNWDTESKKRYRQMVNLIALRYPQEM